jgi:hypothetical protein
LLSSLLCYRSIGCHVNSRAPRPLCCCSGLSSGGARGWSTIHLVCV